MRWRVVSVVIVRKYVDSVVYVSSVGSIGVGKAVDVDLIGFDNVGDALEVNDDIDVEIGDADIEMDDVGIDIMAGVDVSVDFCKISVVELIADGSSLTSFA